MHLNELILAAMVLLAVFTPRLGDRAFSLVESLGAALARRKRFVLLAVPFVAISARLALLPLFPAPILEFPDEFSYLLSADTFAHGRLANPPHAMWVFFETFHVLQHPTYASKFFPAQGSVLALGQMLGHPWIGVLLSMAAMTTAVTWMLQGWFPAPWALLGTVLVLVRFDLFNYWINCYWGGAIAATGGALVLGAFRRLLHRPRWRDSFLLGIGAALLANSRPYEGFLFCLPVAVALAIWLFRQEISVLKTTAPPVLIPAASVLLLTVLFMGYYNSQVTGSALLMPEALYTRQYEQTGLFAWQAPDLSLTYQNPQFRELYSTGASKWYRRSWRDWIHRSWHSCKEWWTFFLGGTLSFPFITLPWLLRDRRMRLFFVQFFCVVVGILAIVYFFPHYAAPLTAVVFALVVQAMRHLRQWKVGDRPVGVALTRVVMLSVLANVPYYAWTQARQPPAAESWNAGRARIVRQLDATPGHHLVIVRYREDHWPSNEWVYNGADIEGAKIVWAREIPGRDLQPLFDYFRDRRVWLLNADVLPAVLEPYTSPPPRSSNP